MPHEDHAANIEFAFLIVKCMSMVAKTLDNTFRFLIVFSYSSAIGNDVIGGVCTLTVLQHILNYVLVLLWS